VAPPAGGQGGALDAAGVRRVWSEVLAAARSQSRSIEAMLVNATVRAVEGDTLVLGIGAPSLARRLSESRNADIVSAALHSVLGVRWQVRCESGDAPVAPPAGGRASAPRRSEPPSRPQQATPPPRAQRQAPTRKAPASDDGVPLPPEPPDEDAPPEDDEEAMLAEAAVPVSDAERRDPEEAAIELLTTQLGARAIERP
jgi:DNA polymerase-3 subunit gamma/tau